MDKAFVKTAEWLQRTKACLMDLKLSDYDDVKHVNRALDALQCIDNALIVLQFKEE